MTWQIALSKTNRIVHSMLSRLILAKQLQPQPDLQAAGLLYRLTMGCISDDLCSWSGQSSPCSSSQPSYIAVRGMATKKAGGTARQKPDTPGRNLGTKFCHNELVFPGQIIVRQRGTKWHAGDNVGLGRDHTIFSKAVGRVRFTTEPGPRDQERTVVSVDAIGTVGFGSLMQVQSCMLGCGHHVPQLHRLSNAGRGAGSDGGKAVTNQEGVDAGVNRTCSTRGSPVFPFESNRSSSHWSTVEKLAVFVLCQTLVSKSRANWRCCADLPLVNAAQLSCCSTSCSCFEPLVRLNFCSCLVMCSLLGIRCSVEAWDSSLSFILFFHCLRMGRQSG
jgi:large subunit ribosomal protein L27